MESFPTSKRTDERFPILAHVKFRLVSSPDGSKPEAELHNGNNVIWNISRTGLFLATKNYAEIKSLLVFYRGRAVGVKHVPLVEHGFDDRVHSRRVHERTASRRALSARSMASSQVGIPSRVLN